MTKPKNFRTGDWKTQITLNLLAKFDFTRMGFLGGEAVERSEVRQKLPGRANQMWANRRDDDADFLPCPTYRK